MIFRYVPKKWGKALRKCKNSCREILWDLEEGWNFWDNLDTERRSSLRIHEFGRAESSIATGNEVILPTLPVKCSALEATEYGFSYLRFIAYQENLHALIWTTIPRNRCQLSRSITISNFPNIPLSNICKLYF